MDKALKIINKMKKEGLFSTYAIGGGIAALFYIEPVTTFDLDIFIIMPDEQSKQLLSLSPVYTWLDKHGYKPQKEQVLIEGVPVQFIPVYNDLVKSAVIDSIDKKYGQTATRVLRPEYLIAIMLQAYRPKDRDRLLKFFEESDYSEERLHSILVKHNLKEAYNNFWRQYYGK